MIAPLIVMLVALLAGLAFVSLRRLELNRGARFFELKRAALDSYAETFWVALVTGGVPVSWRRHMGAVLHDMSHISVRVAVELLRTVERPLARLSYKMRVAAPKAGSAPVSDFLKTLSPERK